MSHLTHAGIPATSFTDWFVTRLTNLREAIRLRREYSQVVYELSMLGDHELADIGINRSHITSIAREATYGANA